MPRKYPFDNTKTVFNQIFRIKKGCFVMNFQLKISTFAPLFCAKV